MSTPRSTRRPDPAPCRLANRAAVVLLVSAALFAAGCTSFTRTSYETLYEGQPADAVRRRLGAPDEVRGDTWRYVHARPPYYAADLRFENGRLAEKTWYVEPPAETPGK